LAGPSNDVRARFGHALREARVRGRFTQEQLAERSGLSYKFIGEIERGRGNPTLVTMTRLASALGIELAALIASPSAPRAVAPPEYRISKRELLAVREAVASIEALVKQVARPTYRRARSRRR
jgi:transcriptional regulator with XRE-family HTH domain